MRCTLLVLAAVLAGCPAPSADKPHDTDTGPEPIEPGSETVSASWDVDLFSMYESPTIERFDTMDGRRKLDRMVIAVDHTADLTVALENGSAFALEADDYSAELYFQTIIQLGLVEDEDDSPPFFGPGAFSAFLSEDLAAADGTEDAGPDFHESTASDTIQSEFEFDWEESPHFMEAMQGTEPLGMVVGGFSEMWVYWNDEHGGEALLYAEATAIRYAGTMTVTYEYSAAEE